MIKNIVFDLGNVLISFRPSDYFDKNNYPDNMKSRILSDIFGGPEWHQLDNGDINISQAIDSIALKSSLNRQEIAHIFNLRTSIMFPLDKNVGLLPGLKKEGFRLYYLSNFPLDIFEEIKSGYFFFRHFDGGVISSEAKLSKPDIRIYILLLKKFQLVPEECLYIDDLEVNVRAAEKTGMNGLVTFGSEEISQQVAAVLNHNN
jgi:epoxide hydrolase-like predicted phosphatase